VETLPAHGLPPLRRDHMTMPDLGRTGPPSRYAMFNGRFRKDASVDPVIALAEAELAPHGGPLFDGHRRDAPSSWRVA
jgi:hypothetical protein